ncbi:cytochrome c3 family protein [Polyangium spumosum]|uniref:nitrite reductase (cytochrome; ammonia-forming) n=1 Tax=Polyangium spumosum TaxID=889282 RepID=A0A6N7PW07_9BACT|nr:cytochrome c3 family protein [Polyangium spumosum]MRG95026.1 NrfA- nitrite reduction protein [Polyangium spumosum]
MSTRTSIVAWLLLTGLVGGFGAFRLTSSDQTLYLPDETSHGHHQIEMACSSCHTPFGGVQDDACTNCHGEQRTAADSHPASKFNDPRNAGNLEKIDARRCVTCHVEHWPEGTHREGYTLPVDFCVECHGDVGTERPSHAGMAFNTCSDAGCHNYHDNRALWEDYLKKHLGEPVVLASAKVLPRGVAVVAKETKSLGAKDQDAPRTVAFSAALVSEWEASAHARAGVNCSGCHGGTPGTPWTNKPPLTLCAGCHAEQNKGFGQGKHGMRSAVGLGPMSPAAARLPMRAEAQELEVGCESCHGGHSVNARKAAVDSCLGCHDDEHSRSYQRSPHFKLWEAEMNGAAAAGTGVSCATCHMPREKQSNSAPVVVQHNQNDNLRPSEKMVRNVCTSCHGVGFSLDSIADPELVRANFAGRPKKHVASVDMVEKRAAQGKR